MRTKDEILASLAARGIATPQTWAGTLAELVTETWEPDLFYYCRTLDPEKITVVPSGRTIGDELAEAADRHRRWAVQPLYDFDLSGAALLTPGEAYLESVWGSPLALLREGVTAYRNIRSRSGEILESVYPQDFQIRFAKSEPRQVPLPPNVDELPSLTGQRIGAALEELRARSLFGVFEWGTKATRSVILDWKPLIDDERTDALCRILRQPPMTGLVPDFDRPILSTVPAISGDRKVVFDHGARLSHVVTRAVDNGSFNVQFRS